MAINRAGFLARFLYGFFFVAMVPAILVAWAVATSTTVPLPAYPSPSTGFVLAGLGLLLMVAAFHGLWRHGGGLPMNAFPPPRFVDRGVYGLVAHPIYLGFVLVVGGVSLWAGSASGLWLVTPMVALASAALVLGYERPDLRARFGAARGAPFLSVPSPSAARPGVSAVQPMVSAARPTVSEAGPTVAQRLSVYFTVFLPWFVAYEAVQFLGIPPDAVDSHLAIEGTWQVLEWTELPYASVYLLVLATPLVLPSVRALRRFAVTGLLATAVVTLIYLTVPLVAPPRAFPPTTWLGRLLASEQIFNNTVAAFPAFHVLWAFIAAGLWPKPVRPAVYVWAAAVAVSCVTTGMYSLADVAFALLLYPAFRRYDAVWNALRRAVERLANSWREWRIGPVRIIVHGIYAGLAMALGVLLTGILAGPDALPGLALASLCGLLGAGAWAQWLEGSSVLTRPFGFFGGLAGGILGVAWAGVLGLGGWGLLGALAVAAPFIQAVGRLRCLVQGCCHGGPAPEQVGIRYFHTRSRVTQLGGLAGVSLHPTPLYSILGNLVIGVLLLRLWSLGGAPSLVVGLYLILSGMARFVEESYRAEPQTRVMAGLHIYHWMALLSVMAGMALTGVPTGPVGGAPGLGAAAGSSALPAAPDAWFHTPTPGLLLLTLGMGLAAWFAMGVDFPHSNRWFSRLAEAKGEARLLRSEEWS